MERSSGRQWRRTVGGPALVILLSAIAGGWLLQEGAARADNFYVRVRVLQEIVDRVESSFVDEVDEGYLYDSAIDGLIGALGDPHTSLIPASAYEDLRIRTEGEYGGVGLEVSDRDGHVTVVSPIPGGPSERIGIRSGDRFHAIDGVVVDTMATDGAVGLLRGRPGTTVTVSMLRPGVEEPIDFTIERAVIRLRAVPFALSLEDDVGYVPLRTVSETTTQEVSAAIDSLQAVGMRGLVLDLRGNPGGLLDQGIAVTDLFLDEGDVIVETRGRAGDQNGTYDASRPARYPDLPVVVLVDAASASASEILAGALQDHDRAVVIGETTFGKGSVQTLYRLTGGDVLRLTTARWYTPVGRSIHMDPVDRETEVVHALAISGQAVEPPDVEGRPEFRSVSGRTLLGGGGITPDLFVSPATLASAEVEGVRGILPRLGAFSLGMFNYAVDYVRDHPQLEPGFALSQGDLADFFATLEEAEARIDRADFDRAERFVRFHLEREIALRAWGEAGRFTQSRTSDRQLLRAVELLAGARSTADLLTAAAAADPVPIG